FHAEDDIRDRNVTGVQTCALTIFSDPTSAISALLANKADIALVGAETSIYVKHPNPHDPIINFAQLTQTDGTFRVAKEPNDHFRSEVRRVGKYFKQYI